MQYRLQHPPRYLLRVYALRSALRCGPDPGVHHQNYELSMGELVRFGQLPAPLRVLKLHVGDYPAPFLGPFTSTSSIKYISPDTLLGVQRLTSS